MDKITFLLNIEGNNIDQLLIESEKIVKFLQLQKISTRGFYEQETLVANYSIDIVEQENNDPI